MAAPNLSLNLNPNPTTHTLDRLFTALNPKSLILSQFGNNHDPNLLQLMTESFTIERGPRYKAYADLRESKLRLKREKSLEQQPPNLSLSPPKKQVRFQGNREKGGTGSSSSVLAQSVPDFAAVMRKENRRPPPANMLPPVREKSSTPSPAKNSKMYGVGAKSGGSRSVNSGEKRGGGCGLMAGRKSYATMEELKGFSVAAANAINGESKGGGRSGRGLARNVLGYRQF